MAVLNLLVIGSGGGLDETNLSGYLLKPADASWCDEAIALEAGSGVGALNVLLQKNASLLDEPNVSAYDVYTNVKSYLITHAHLDHISSLVIAAGSLQGHSKQIFGTRFTLESLRTVFNQRIWPNLASDEDSDENTLYKYVQLPTGKSYRKIHPEVSVQSHLVTHGHLCPSSDSTEPATYDSTAFFIRHDSSSLEFLFFGDVGPDALSTNPRILEVWKEAAPKIVNGTLNTIFIECSWPAGREDHLLFGHLSPEHLAEELKALCKEVLKHRQLEERADVRASKRRKLEKSSEASFGDEDLVHTLQGIRIFIMHVKDILDSQAEHPRDVILRQVQDLVGPAGLDLGAQIDVAVSGSIIDL